MCVALKVEDNSFFTHMFNVWFGGLQFLDGYEIQVLSLSLFSLSLSYPICGMSDPQESKRLCQWHLKSSKYHMTCDTYSH